MKKSYQLRSAPSFHQRDVHDNIRRSWRPVLWSENIAHEGGGMLSQKMSQELRLRFTQQQQHNMQQHHGAGAPSVSFPLSCGIHSAFQDTRRYTQRYMYIDFSNSIYCTPSAHENKQKKRIRALFAFQQTAAFWYKKLVLTRAQQMNSMTHTHAHTHTGGNVFMFWTLCSQRD